MIDFEKLNKKYQTILKRWPELSGRQFRDLFCEKHECDYCLNCERFVESTDDDSGDCEECVEGWKEKQDYYDSLEIWIHK